MISLDSIVRFGMAGRFVRTHRRSRSSSRRQAATEREPVPLSSAQLQRSANAGGVIAAQAPQRVLAATEHRIDQLRRNGGRPLSTAERTFFEPRFGRNFDAVRVHIGPGVDRITRSIDARAFTIGKDVFVDRSEVRSNTPDRRLMAHELTHTLQADRENQLGRMIRRTEPDKPKIKRAWCGVKATVVAFSGRVTYGGIPLAEYLKEHGFIEATKDDRLVVSPGGRIVLQFREGVHVELPAGSHDLCNLPPDKQRELRIEEREVNPDREEYNKNKQKFGPTSGGVVG